MGSPALGGVLFTVLFLFPTNEGKFQILTICKDYLPHGERLLLPTVYKP